MQIETKTHNAIIKVE